MKHVFIHITHFVHTTFIRINVGRILILSFLGLSVGFYSCQNNNDIAPKYGKLRIQVVDVNGKPIPFAKVGAFKDIYLNQGGSLPYSSFLSLYDSYNMSDAGKDTGTTDTQGYCTLDSVQAGNSYLIMAHTRQPGSSFTEYYIDYDNYDGGFVLPISLQGATTINARIKLAAANAWVVFWTDASNSGILPIKVKASSSQVDSITAANATAQIKGVGNYVVSVRKGYQKFYGLTKASSCAWTIDTNVIANTFMFIKMATCDNKVVSFYTVDSLVSVNSPISITLGQNQVIGQLTSQTVGLPTGCGASNMVNVNLSPGKYTYFARRSTGDCAWSGTFTVGSSSCQLVRLENCKP